MTDAGGLGSIFGKADVTVLVNGGYVQPGCNSVTGYLCRHMKGAYYNSVNMGKCIMVAYRADSYEQFSRKFTYWIFSLPISTGLSKHTRARTHTRA